MKIYAVNGGAREEGQGYPPSIDVVEPTGFDRRNIRIANEVFAQTMQPDAVPFAEAYKSGWRVNADDLPRKVSIYDARYLVDVDQDGALKYVSQRARDLIERLEPEMHQFEPVEFVDKSGKHIADMYTLIVCQRLDTVDRDKTTGMALSPYRWTSLKTLSRMKPEILPEDADLSEPAHLVYNLKQAGTACLWVDIHLTDGIFMSESMVEAFDREGLTGLARVQMDVAR